MNKKRYLQELDYHLRSLPDEVRHDIIEMYHDQFKIAELEGRSEQDAILSLGRAKANAEKELALYADQFELDQSFKHDSFEEDWGDQSIKQTKHKVNVFALIMLILFNLTIVLFPALAIFLIGLTFWFLSIVLMMTPLFAFWHGGLWSFPELYPVLAVCGLGILLFVAMHYLTRLSNRLIHLYFNGMTRLVKG
ncbi:DUF1700 domain-containing protein [Amphibacillus sp. MSJ-3]|uniref:DUF1700 domain-containing protein n=1 Tax=Amphibacillus sp. MSJ-3 TaxID=2841505 RepID=UPI001C0ECF88|nr:DUF1700 domain-containing protein [Amphibacillus sp. MSJ-3]MBU5593914.1 DUF1700 domain-containing protein [Amphibacillus sp. MSJ-3]